MTFIHFVNEITPHIDSYLAESVIAGYKTIFEYQTDMFMSDDEAKAADQKAEREFTLRDALDAFTENEISIDDPSDIEGYLSDYGTDGLKLISVILNKLGIEPKMKLLADGDVLVIYNNVIINFSKDRVLAAYSKKSFYDRIIDDPDSYLPENYPDPEEKFNSEFWGRPENLYHATTDENIDDIQTDGLVPMSLTRGISNRSIGAAVFTSINPEVIDSYGNNIFKIDTRMMKNDGYTPFVSQEPAFPEAEKINSLLYIYGIEETYEISSHDGMDPDTVIVHGKIPSKYLELI